MVALTGEPFVQLSVLVEEDNLTAPCVSSGPKFNKHVKERARQELHDLSLDNCTKTLLLKYRIATALYRDSRHGTMGDTILDLRICEQSCLRCQPWLDKSRTSADGAKGCLSVSQGKAFLQTVGMA